MTNRPFDFGDLGVPVEANGPRGRSACRHQAQGRRVSGGIRGGVPGLLVAWELRPDGWRGRVVIVRDGEAVELRGAARLLKPAHTSEATTNDAGRPDRAPDGPDDAVYDRSLRSPAAPPPTRQRQPNSHMAQAESGYLRRFVGRLRGLLPASRL